MVDFSGDLGSENFAIVLSNYFFQGLYRKKVNRDIFYDSLFCGFSLAGANAITFIRHQLLIASTEQWDMDVLVDLLKEQLGYILTKLNSFSTSKKVMELFPNMISAKTISSYIMLGRYKEAPNLKLEQREFRGLLYVVHLLGGYYSFKFHIGEIEKIKNENWDIEEMIGHIELGLVKAWNSMASTKLGMSVFQKISIDSLAGLQDPVDLLLKNCKQNIAYKFQGHAVKKDS